MKTIFRRLRQCVYKDILASLNVFKITIRFATNFQFLITSVTATTLFVTAIASAYATSLVTLITNKMNKTGGKTMILTVVKTTG